MDIIYITEFVELAKTCDFQETADALFVSQSTLSRHIQKLESDLGKTLFIRSSRKAELSNDGKAFLPYAEKICHAYREYLNVSATSHNENGRLTIGSVPMLSHYRILQALSDFKKNYSPPRLEIIESDTQALLKALENGQCDVAFILAEDVEESCFPHITYYVDTLSAVLPPNHPLADRSQINLEQLEDESFIFQQEPILRKASLKACRNAGFEPKTENISMSARHIFEMVSRGGYCTLALTRHAVRYGKGRMAVIRITPEIRLRLDLIYSHSNITSHYTQQFISFISNAHIF